MGKSSDTGGTDAGSARAVRRAPWGELQDATHEIDGAAEANF